MAYTPPKLEDIGLEKYLNETATDHNNRGYDDFVRLITEPDEAGEMRPKTKVARAMNVERRTIGRWIELYEEVRAK